MLLHILSYVVGLFHGMCVSLLYYYLLIQSAHTHNFIVIIKIMYHNNRNSSSSSDQHEHVPTNNIDMNPRISFSNDFVESSSNSYNSPHSRLMNMHQPPSPLPPVSSDFEFSVSSYSMMSADELFSKGRLLPYKNNHPLQKTVSTLRQELLTSAEEDDSDNGGASVNVSNSMRPPKGGGRWKGLLGLRKSSKKADNTSSLHRSAFLPHDQPHNFNGNSE